MDIKEAVDIVLATKEAQALLNTFAKVEYNKKFSHVKPKLDGSFHCYHSFELINENEIAVNFIYGAGDREYTDYFIIKIG